MPFTITTGTRLPCRYCDARPIDTVDETAVTAALARPGVGKFVGHRPCCRAVGDVVVARDHGLVALQAARIVETVVSVGFPASQSALPKYGNRAALDFRRVTVRSAVTDYGYASNLGITLSHNAGGPVVVSALTNLEGPGDGE